MKRIFYGFMALMFSCGMVFIAQTASAEDASLESLKEELRAEYKSDLNIYKALEDKATYEAKDMRQALVNMGIEAKKIRDLMKEIKSQSDEAEVASLKEQLQGHVATFRQDRAQFSDTYASLQKPQEVQVKTEAMPEPEATINVAEEMEEEIEFEEEPAEEMERELAEDSTEEGFDEKIVISENMTAEEEEEALESEWE